METDGQRARRRMKELIEGDPQRREGAHRRAVAGDSPWFVELVADGLEEVSYHLPGDSVSALPEEVQSWFSKAGDIEIPDIEFPDIDL